MNSPGQADPLAGLIQARQQPDEPSFTRNISEIGEKVINRFKDEDSDSEKRQRRTIFGKLVNKEEYHETPDEVRRAEGEHACTFSNDADVSPDYLRVHSHKKSKRDFGHLFLAQEFQAQGAIWSMKFSNDGRYLATGGQDTTVRVWKVLANCEDRKSLRDTLRAPVFRDTPYREFNGHTADVLDLSWSTNNFLLSSSMDKTVRLWHVTRTECLCCFQHSDFVTSIAFHPKDDRFFLSGSLDCKLRLWDIAEKKVAYWNELPDLITAVAFDPMGKIAIAGSSTGLCLFYDADGLRYNTQIHVKSTRGRNSKGSKITGIQATALHPENPHSTVVLLITSNDSRIRIYNMRDKALVFKLKGNQNNFSQIRASFSDDYRYVICGSEDKQVYIWNSRPRSNEYKLNFGYEHFAVHADIVSATCFAPGASRVLLAASGDAMYNFVSSIDGSVNDPADGNIVICADYNGRIKVFRQDSAASVRDRMQEKEIEDARDTTEKEKEKEREREKEREKEKEKELKSVKEREKEMKPKSRKSVMSDISEHGSVKPLRSKESDRILTALAPNDNPYLNEMGESYAFYDVRPGVPRFNTSVSWKKDDGVRCTECGGVDFTGRRKSGAIELICSNCDTVIT